MCPVLAGVWANDCRMFPVFGGVWTNDYRMFPVFGRVEQNDYPVKCPKMPKKCPKIRRCAPKSPHSGEFGRVTRECSRYSGESGRMTTECPRYSPESGRMTNECARHSESVRANEYRKKRVFVIRHSRVHSHSLFASVKPLVYTPIAVKCMSNKPWIRHESSPPRIPGRAQARKRGKRHARGGGRFPVLLPMRARNRLWFGPTKHFRVGRYMANRRSINSKSLSQWVYSHAHAEPTG